MARYQAVRGTFDVLPDQVPRWQHLESTARELAQRFGFYEIRTPLFEQAELYTKGMGVMSGLIEKELWTFKDKFGQKLALRTDMTTGVVRAFQQNKLFDSSYLNKVFYVGPVFLLGKEGEERSRQSHQFGIEAIGSDSPALDAEVIAFAAALCETLGIEDYSIRLNSLGGEDCRPPYLQKLKEYFGTHSDQLCSTCKRKYKAHPDWVLSCEEEGCKNLSQVAPTIYGMLSNGARTHFSQLREYLEAMELPVELDPRVVRDTEYYNRTVFEIRSGEKSLGFGGRYDGLVEKLGGKSTPAVGFALSLETVNELLGEDLEVDTPTPQIFFQPEGPESSKILVPLLNTLRQRGVCAEFDYRAGNSRRSNSIPEGCEYVIVLDESNAFRGHAILKTNDKSKDEKVPVGRLRNRVLHLVGVSEDSEKDGSLSGRKRLRRGRKRTEDNDNTDDDKDKSGKDDKDSGSGRRGRRGRRGRGSRSNEDNNEKDRGSRSGGGRDKKSRGRERDRDKDRDKDKDRDRDRDRDRERDKDSKDKEQDKSRSRRSRSRGGDKDRDSSDDGGKAIVPAFKLGGLSGKADTPAALKQKSSTPKSAPANVGGSLNWSILPGKEGGKGNGKSGAPRDGGSDS